MSKVWFVTGASRGFGRRFVEAALSRGDKVAATVRDTTTLTALVTVHSSRVPAGFPPQRFRTGRPSTVPMD
jgi:NAD(P)-dependent dehydrogenase (short-subunit alcohol dehydrogenase family)